MIICYAKQNTCLPQQTTSPPKNVSAQVSIPVFVPCWQSVAMIRSRASGPNTWRHSQTSRPGTRTEKWDAQGSLVGSWLFFTNPILKKKWCDVRQNGLGEVHLPPRIRSEHSKKTNEWQPPRPIYVPGVLNSTTKNIGDECSPASNNWNPYNIYN